MTVLTAIISASIAREKVNNENGIYGIFDRNY